MKTKERVLVLETEVKALNAKVKKFETIMEAVGILFQSPTLPPGHRRATFCPLLVINLSSRLDLVHTHFF